MNVTDTLRLLAALEDEDVDYVLIGSMGMAVHGRMKRDTLREQDHADAAALKRRFDLEH